MVWFKLGVIVACTGGLMGLLVINSRIWRACILAVTSGVLLGLVGILNWLLNHEKRLLEAVPQVDAPSVKGYVITHVMREWTFSADLNFTYWVLLAFLLAAPFVMVKQRKHSTGHL
jgi:hypothetical protein